MKFKRRNYLLLMTFTICTMSFGIRDGAAGTVDCLTLDDIDGLGLQTKFQDAVNTIQNNATGFGNRAAILPNPTTGSELDQLFIRNDANTLYVAITGNLPPSDLLENTVLVFIETDGSNFDSQIHSAAMTGSSALINMDGVRLDFGPNYAVALWNNQGTPLGLLHTMTNPNDVGQSLSAGTHFAMDNSNLAGVNSESASDPGQQTVNAGTAVTGFEIAIPLAMLGYDPVPITSPTNIKVHAILANGVGYVSNQSLPPLKATDGLLGGKVGCLGINDPTGTPPHEVNLLAAFPDTQYVTYSLDPGNAAPGGSLDGGITDADWGEPASIQNNHTCFDDAHSFSASLTSGSELDQIFLASDLAKLYIGVTGNIPINDGNKNTLVVFIDIGSGGSNPLATGENFYTGGSGAVAGMAGLELPAGFSPKYALQYWRENGQHKATLQDLEFGNSDFIVMEYTTSALRHLDPAVNAYGVNLQNEEGVNTIAGDDPVQQAIKATSAKHGIQFSMNLTDAPGTTPTPFGGLGYDIIGNPHIKLLAAVVSGSGFMSNQWLPPLRKTTGEVRMSNDSVAPAIALSDASLANAPSTIFSNLTATLAAANLLERVTSIKVDVDITHPAMEELTIDLYHPASNRTVRLWDGDASGADMNTTFAHGGASLATWTAPGMAEFTVHDPVGNSLLTFNDVNPTDGDWVLFVTDNVNGNADPNNKLNSWSIELTEDVGGGVDCLGDIAGSSPPVSISSDYPTAEVIDVDPTTVSNENAPDFNAPHSPGSNIPDAYGNGPFATQNNYTCFGDASDPGLQFTAGSEMDQLFVSNSAERLHLGITGNLELNGNAFVILFDTITGGESTLTGNPTPPRPIGGNPDNQAGEPGLNGAVLDGCMMADYALSVATFGDGSYIAELTDLSSPGPSKLLGYQNMDSGTGILRAPDNNSGSELDQLFLSNDADNLYIGLTGNLEGNGNAIIVLIETVGSGSNTITTTGSSGWPSPLAGVAPTAGNNGLNGDVMPAGFNPDYAIVIQRTNSTFQTGKLCNLNDTGSAPVSIGYVNNGVISSNTYAANNGNTLGVNGDNLDTNQVSHAPSATTGYQLAISRASLGLAAPAGNGASISLVAVVTGDKGYWSNQAMPPVTGSNINNLSNPNVDPVDTTGILNTQAYVIAGSGTPPASYNGTALPTYMGTPVATQTNYTGFGNQGVNARYNNDNCVLIAFGNNNSGGVSGCTLVGSPNCTDCLGGDVSEAGQVDTGMEVDIALADLGLPPVSGGGGPTIRMLAMVTSNTGYASNQCLPGLGGGECNLGFGPSINLGNIPGDQCLSYTLEASAPCGADPADIDGDGDVDPDDITVFVNVLLGTNSDLCPLMKANINPAAPLGINGNDIKLFVTNYLN